jgi:hypothetical protein
MVPDLRQNCSILPNALLQVTSAEGMATLKPRSRHHLESLSSEDLFSLVTSGNTETRYMQLVYAIQSKKSLQQTLSPNTFVKASSDT